MGNQIIKQPDGHYAIFNTNSDAIVVWDAEGDEIVEWFAERAAEQARDDARRQLGHVASDEPRRAYFQFAMTWDEALREDQEHGGEAWNDFSASAQKASET